VRWDQFQREQLMSVVSEVSVHREEADPDTEDADADADIEEQLHRTENDDEDVAEDLEGRTDIYAAKRAEFEASLSPRDVTLIRQYEEARDACHVANEAARKEQESQYLESDLASRWIFRRVFELGWSPDRFAAFDSEIRDDVGREAQKAERIGKKYQWLAYHEFAAYVFDHRPLHHDSMSESESYDGPWQRHLRDIDPSFLVKQVLHDAGAGYFWWLPLTDPLPEGEQLTNQRWLAHLESIPDFVRILSLSKPADRSQWYPLELHGEWNESEETQEERGDTLRRQLTFSLYSFFVLKKQLRPFVNGLRQQQWGSIDAAPVAYYEPFLGEFPWAPSFRDYVVDAETDVNERVDQENSQFQRFAGTLAASTVMHYVHEGRTFDCSLTETCSACTPSTWLARHMRLAWKCEGFAFVGPEGTVLAHDPSWENAGPSAFLVEKGALEKFLNGPRWVMVWVLIGEKLLLGDETGRDKERPRISVFRHIYSMSAGRRPKTESRTFGNLGQAPADY
jgi:hypothetical protein